MLRSKLLNAKNANSLPHYEVSSFFEGFFVHATGITLNKFLNLNGSYIRKVKWRHDDLLR